MKEVLRDQQESFFSPPPTHQSPPRGLRNSLAALGFAALSALGMSAPAFAAPPFELDGNVAPNDFPGDDWADIYNGTDSAGAKTGIISDPQGPSETIFTGGGSKDEQDIPNWKSRSGNPPDKDDITHAMAAFYVNPDNGHNVLVFGMDRFDVNGDAQLGFWFIKDDNFAVVPGSNFQGQHSIGDLLVLSNFSKGGGTPTIEVYIWNGFTAVPVGTGGAVECSGGWIPGGQDFCGITNTTPGETPPWLYLDKDGNTSYQRGAFFEGAVDLTAIGADPCFTNFLSESRSSTSITAVLKDFVTGGFPVCSIDVTKDCTNARLNATEDMIIYDISGGVTATGGTVYNVQLSDMPAADGPFQWVDCGNPANVLGTFPLTSLAAGVEACYLNTITVPLASNGLSDTVSASANTNPDGVSGTNLTDNQAATCPLLQISPMVMVDKDCDTVIDTSGGVVAAKVNISGQVCNTGDTTLSSVQVSDSEAGVVLSGATLAPGDCQSYTGMYTPTEAVDGMGNPTTDPSEVTFKDTVTASALDIFGQPVMQQTANACCTLCPGGEGEQCGMNGNNSH